MGAAGQTVGGSETAREAAEEEAEDGNVVVEEVSVDDRVHHDAHTHHLAHPHTPTPTHPHTRPVLPALAHYVERALPLAEVELTQPALALWFGHELAGLSPEACSGAHSAVSVQVYAPKEPCQRRENCPVKETYVLRMTCLRTRCISLSLSLSLSHSFCLSLSLSLSPFPSLSPPLLHSIPLSLPLSHSLNLSLSLTHTHTLSLNPSPSLCLFTSVTDTSPGSPCP